MTNPMSNDIVKKAMDSMYGHKQQPSPDAAAVSAIHRVPLWCAYRHNGALLRTQFRQTWYVARQDSSFGIEKACDSGAYWRSDDAPNRAIPPHIGLVKQLKEVLDQVSDLISSFGTQTVSVISAIEEAIKNKAWESGHVTGPRLKQIL
jgi:hypothetical protein